MTALKSFGAVTAGFLTVVSLSIGTDLILETLHVFPPQHEPGSYKWWMLLLALIYRSIYMIAGGYLTATLAPNRPMRHVIILGIIGVAVSILGTVLMWNQGSHWYPIVLTITALPCTWTGGRLKTN